MVSESTGIRVLIVDDEQIIADTLAMICRSQGFQAEAAYSGETAIEMAARLHPQVLISDVLLGGISGVDAAVEICREIPDCHVILLSGQTIAPEFADRIRDSGHSFEVLIKPVRPEALLRRLQSLV